MNRLVSARVLCERLGLATTTFHRRRLELEAKGFPRRLPVLNKYDMRAVDNWLATQNHPSNDAPVKKKDWGTCSDYDPLMRALDDDREH